MSVYAKKPHPTLGPQVTGDAYLQFNKLQFKLDRMLTDRMRKNAEKWLTEEFNQNFQGRVVAVAGDVLQAADGGDILQQQRHVKRRKVSAAEFFADSDASDESEDSVLGDELKDYLALPQIKFKTERDATDWWLENRKKFPNLEVMARQYLGCPASSATVERLFSAVGIAFSAKRRCSDPSTIECIMFAKANLP